jgi:hypothetical protein
MRCYDFRDHLAAIRVGAVGGAWSREWVELVIGAVDYIDNHLRLRRNRFVHDQWLAAGEPAQVSHFSPIPKIVRSQAHMARIVVPTQRQVRELSEITDTTEEVAEHKSYLAFLGDIAARSNPVGCSPLGLRAELGWASGGPNWPSVTPLRSRH